MRFEVLGPVRVCRDGEVVAVAGVMRRNLLAMLVAQANASVSVDALLDALWGQQVDARATQRLHVHVHKLRAVLGDPGRITYGPGGYSLRVLPGELDIDEFDMLVDEATSVTGSEPQRCVELLRKAVGLFRGVPYHGVDLVGLAGEVQRCAERRLVALEELYAAELRCGRHAAVVGELTELASQYPVRERVHGLLMTALYQGGRQADALAVYRTVRQALVDELGLEPGPELREIEQQVLAGQTIPTSGHSQPTRAVPAQLPPAPAGFVGRQSTLGELDALVTGHDESESAVVVSVTGSGGVGKTALALWWAHQARDRFRDGHLYVDLRGYGPDEPVRVDDALAGFLRALGMDGAAIPHDTSERSARLRSLLAGTRTLLVLDNAGSVDQVRALLPASPGCVALVTSRDPLVGLSARDGAHRVMLYQFSTDEAHDLLRALLGTDRITAEPAAINRLILRCARLPLALRIAAERIRLRPASTVDDLVDELDDPDERLDALDTGGDAYSSVRSILSWSYHQLPEPAAGMFRLWGLHPGHDIDKPALAALTGHDTRTTRRALDTLRHAHLAHETTPGRYHLHDLLRAYATELTHHTDTPDVRHAASARLFDHYLSTAVRAMEWIAPHESELPTNHPAQTTPINAFTTHETARDWLDTERANLITLVEHAHDRGLPTYTTDLATILWQYFDIGWHQDDAKLVYTHALDVAHQRHDQIAEAIALRNLGLTRYRVNEYEQATAYLEQALQLQLELGEGKSQAMTLNYLAGAYQIVGRVDDAFSQLRWALELCREHGDRPREMRLLQNLAILHRRRGQRAEAEQCLNRALDIAEEVDHRSNKARTLRDLARVCMESARPGDALDYAHRARKIAKEEGMRAVESTILDTLGIVNRQLGNTEKAIEHRHEALAFARTSGDNILVAKILNGLAETSVATGRTDEAYRLYWEALGIDFGGASRHQHARAHAGLGDLHASLDEHSTAIEQWQQALSIYRDLQAPEADEVAAKLLDINSGTNSRTDQD